MVIDTNVIRTADGLAGHADGAFRQASLDLLVAARTDVVHLDDSALILGEYLAGVGSDRPYAPGTVFVHELFQVQYTQRCRRVAITPHAQRSFVEFPEDDRLAAFDADDRKFVAVARAAEPRPPIVNAVDSDWAPVADALADHGVAVVQLCPHLDPLLSKGI